tara:strand:- start:29873 stop:30475 length:603 start_codon:yes stop_codon:yes gene_type:complete
MLNLSYSYDQHSTRLFIEGLPDFSSGQKLDTIGIISTWKLIIVGFPDLEGNLDHLRKLMNAVYPYANNYIATNKRIISESNDLITINTIDNGHEFKLNSTKPDVKPLTIILDDAELIDLLSCLDKLRLDKRVNINWNISEEPFYRSKLNKITKINISHIISPVIGSLVVSFVAGIFFLTINTEYLNKPANVDFNQKESTQ